MTQVAIKNPANGRKAWFSLPFYFGQLSKIGHSGSYDDDVEILQVVGDSPLSEGRASLHDLEKANRHAEKSL